MKWNKEIILKIDLLSLILLGVFCLTILTIYLNNERRFDTMNEKVQFLHHRYGDFSLLDDRINVLEEICRHERK